MSLPPLDQHTQKRLQDHAPRTWQRMLSGRRLNLIEPSPLDIEISDIALGLSRNSRWNGQTVGEHAWSVAQHSLLVVDILRDLVPDASPQFLLAGLLHDASEYVTHDMITPLKAVVGDVFKEVELRLTRAIYLRFGLPADVSDSEKVLIKKADWIAAATEATQLAGFTAHEVKKILHIKADPLDAFPLVPLPSQQAAGAFLAAFHQLDSLRY